MPTFQYIAYDQKGRKLSSSSTADSERQLRRELKERGLFADAVEEVTPRRRRLSWLAPRLSRADLSLLIRQLAILLNSGMALEEAFRLVAEQTENRAQRQVLESWRGSVLSGYSFAAALRQSPYRINDRVIASIEVAEETGHLHEVLSRLADEMEVENDNRQTLIKGMIYPLIMVLVAAVVIGVMIAYVVPQVTKVFANARQELPPLTQVTIALSQFTRSYGLFILAFLFVLAAGGRYLLQQPARRRNWQRLLLRMPLIGNWMLLAVLADWSRSMGTLLRTGVPVLTSLTISAAGIGNLYLQEKMQRVAEKVRQGNSLFYSLRSERFVPGFMLHMVSSGESSGELDGMLIRVGDYYSTQLRNSVETALKLLEPALIVLMGLVILLIVGAVLVPIVKMNQLI